MSEVLRVELSGTLEGKGHAIVGWYLSDPEMAGVEIERVSLNSCRKVGRDLGLDLSDLLDERARLWSKTMRYEAACLILWTRRGVLNKEETKQMKEERAQAARACPAIGEAQRFYMRSELMAAHHEGFVSRVAQAMRGV
ncbi:hypothetical protein SAMN06265338_1681, partial [Rhodoblastus acidophilus]